MKDERVIQTGHKIWSEIGKIVYWFVAAAFVTKILLLRMNLNDCVVEYVILIGVPVYQLIRCWQLKLRVYKPVSKKKYWIREIRVTAATLAVYIGVFLGGSDQAVKEKGVALLAFAATLLLTRFLIFRMDKKRSDQLDKELEEQED